MQSWPPDSKIYEDLAERLLRKKWDLIGLDQWLTFWWVPTIFTSGILVVFMLFL